MSTNEIPMSLSGYVGGDVTHKVLPSGIDYATFRVATTPRRFDSAAARWTDMHTTWMSVTCYRALAKHVHECVKTGHPVVITGKLRTLHYAGDGGEVKEKQVLEADSVGHDLRRGTSKFTRLPRRDPSVTQLASATRSPSGFDSMRDAQAERNDRDDEADIDTASEVGPDELDDSEELGERVEAVA